jgi:hypothetical protein
MELLWKHYIDNVDILVKILYKPAVEALVMNASKDLGKIDALTEALLFAINFASVTTMSIEECQEIHGEERSVLLQRYRHSLEQVLAQVGLVTFQDVVVCQALILLIVGLHPYLLNSPLIMSGMFSTKGCSLYLDAEWHGYPYCSSDGHASRKRILFREYSQH